jgi:8-oxo-dGTP diphosphatase
VEICASKKNSALDDDITVVAHFDAFQQQLQQGVSMAAKLMNVEEAKLVRAAGGIITRNGRGPVQVAVIHRPRYDDWTFPKGKLDGSESPEDAALREVEEETGFRCRLVRPVACTAYVDGKGREKVVCYWLMERVDGRFRVSKEVDELRWLSSEKAAELLTYRRDKALLRSLDLD